MVDSVKRYKEGVELSAEVEEMVRIDDLYYADVEVDADLRTDALYYAEREELEEYVEGTSEESVEGTYPSFRKIPRLYSNVCITEKIDGTNGLIHISKEGRVRAGSRNRWLGIDQDNHGFCSWVVANMYELAKLGPGHHYGEWYGKGIQRGYGLKEKRFALFNPTVDISNIDAPGLTKVPVLYTGGFSAEVLSDAEADIACGGSKAVDGWAKPEGLMVYFTQSQSYFKVPI